MSFVHLNVHSEFSLVSSTIRIKALVDTAVDKGFPAIAVTDAGNLFAVVKFFRAAIAKGVKPIVGVDFTLQDECLNQFRLVLLCQNAIGYKNLTHLVSKSYLEGQHAGHPTLRLPWLQDRTEGLIALSGGMAGDIGQALLQEREDIAKECAQQWLSLFPDRFYMEFQRLGKPGEHIYFERAYQLAQAMGIAPVASNDVQFLDAQSFEAHEARVCINQGRLLSDPRRPRQFTAQQYLRGTEQMQQLFDDMPEALKNSVEIAKRCNLQLQLGKNYLPVFPIPEQETLESFFSKQAQDGLQQRFEQSGISDSDTQSAYQARLQWELDTIIKMGFPGYFMIVSDFIRWAKAQRIPVGPGRGSGAGSLVAYALKITDLDPLQYELLFERFLNPERVSLPDFDVDFCMDRRDEVIEYVADRYGKDRVAQIITYGTMAAKAVVRDVGRVLGHPYGFVDQIAKMIPFEIGITLEKALAQEERFRERYEQEEDVRNLLDLAMSLEGLARNAGKHAGGVVISPSVLTDFTPLFCEPDGTNVVTQLDKDDVEAVGLVKFDFLGLRTLTIIDWAIIEINKGLASNGAEPLRIETIPTDDAATFQLLQECQTTAVFQLESRGMKDLIKRLQPDHFEEIIALVALFRPGPLRSGMVDDFIDRKHGRAKVDYPHPKLEEILKPTYGVILYQEQVMQIAQVLAGYSLGGADLLRRAMGKKKAEEMAKQRQVFSDGATGLGVDEAVAQFIFDLMEKFAGYGFNKSHSAAYALLAYQTAWLKAHFPAAFMAAVLSADMDNTDKVVTLIDECNSMGIDIISPDVNRCDYKFVVADEKTIVYGLGAIKGVGKGAIDSIRQSRGRGFEDLFDFCRRIDLKKVNRRTLESLAKAGALDKLGPSRAAVMASLEKAWRGAEQHQDQLASGQQDLFQFDSQLSERELTAFETGYLTQAQALRGEKETLGLYLTGHPIEQYVSELKHFITDRIADLKPTQDQRVIIAGLVVSIRTLASKRGGRMAFVSLDDRSGRIELAVFSEIFQRYRELINKDRLLVVQGQVSVDEYTGGCRMSADKLYDLEQARAAFAKHLRVRVQHADASHLIGALKDTMDAFREGSCPVVIDYNNKNARVMLRLGESWRVNPTEELLHRLKKTSLFEDVSIEY